MTEAQINRKKKENKCRKATKKYMRKVLTSVGDHLACALCGRIVHKNNGEKQTASDITIDHLISVANGGSINNFNNLAIVCRGCNTTKGAKSIDPNKLISSFDSLTIIATI